MKTRAETREMQSDDELFGAKAANYNSFNKIIYRDFH